MKKNLYIANLLVAGLMTFTGCTDGFESDNANKAGYTPELQEYDLQKYVLNLGVMQQGIYFNYDWGRGTDWTFQTIQNLGHDMFAGYFHDMNNSFNDKNSVYALNDGWTGSAWTYTYGYIMTAAQKSEKINQEQKGLLGVTKILKVELMHRIADTYGPIVYTKFGQEEGDNVDSQEAAYRQFFKDLDEGVKLINEYKKANAALEPFAAADILMPAGKRTLSQWVKFANSLRLRLAIRVSMSAPDLARAEVAKAMDATAGGVLESADETVAVSTESGYKNPLGTVNEGWGEVFMGATMESVLVGYNDPRLIKYYSKAEGGDIKDEKGNLIIAERNKIAGTYKGVPQGTGVTVKDENRYRLHSKSTITKQTDVILMTAAEVWFLRAEAALRGFTSENVKDCYEKGITVSCQQWGVNVGDYLTSDATPSDYVDAFEAKYDVKALIKVTPKWDGGASPEEQLERILTQKWIACYPEGYEAWTEQRRTGYPQLFKVFVNNSGGAIDTNIRIRRLPYPSDIQKNNPTQYSALKKALGGEDNGGTRLWWDTGRNF